MFTASQVTMQFDSAAQATIFSDSAQMLANIIRLVSHILHLETFFIASLFRDTLDQNCMEPSLTQISTMQSAWAGQRTSMVGRSRTFRTILRGLLFGI
jgi:hypothetical protein